MRFKVNESIDPFLGSITIKKIVQSKKLFMQFRLTLVQNKSIHLSKGKLFLNSCGGGDILVCD